MDNTRAGMKTVKTVMSKVDNLSEETREMVENLINEYCKQLDDYMKVIDSTLYNATEPLTNEQLEEYILNLASILYFTGSAQEDLGIKEDACKSLRTNVFNRARELAEGTVADKDTAGTLACQCEAIVQAIYGRAYKKIKIKSDAGYEMLNSLKKVMNKRITEAELSNNRYGGKLDDDVR